MCAALFCRLQRQLPTSDEVGMRKNLTRTLIRPIDWLVGEFPHYRLI